MHNPEDIDFIEISDSTHTADPRSLISVSNVNIIVDVFHLLNHGEDLSHSVGSLRSHDLETQKDDTDGEFQFPHPKVTNLPSKALHGLWKSCGGLSP